MLFMDRTLGFLGILFLIVSSLISCSTQEKSGDDADKGNDAILSDELAEAQGFSDALRNAIEYSDERLELLELYLKQYRSDPSEGNLQQVLDQIIIADFSYIEDNFTDKEKVILMKQKMKVDNAINAANSLVSGAVARLKTPLITNEDYLMDKGTETFPFYVQKGDRIFYTISSAERFTVKLYNADTEKVIKSYSKNTAVSDSLQADNSAIWLLQVIPTGNQYMEMSVKRSADDPARLHQVRPVYAHERDAQKGDFLARRINGVQMKNLFEEPRKFTLRGQIKAYFSGSSRALVALDVPQGATDVLYSLRISTNESDRSTDGEFYQGMNISYQRVKFLGLPLYENSYGSGLLAQLLGDNQPLREEDSYINMYVFFSSALAKKFQDGAKAETLKYSVDYSTLGTQSCNGRIPVKGNRKIYLAFENERMRYNNYVWLEAVSAVPSTEYVTTHYSLMEYEDEDEL